MHKYIQADTLTQACTHIHSHSHTHTPTNVGQFHMDRPPGYLKAWTKNDTWQYCSNVHINVSFLWRCQIHYNHIKPSSAFLPKWYHTAHTTTHKKYMYQRGILRENNIWNLQMFSYSYTLLCTCEINKTLYVQSTCQAMKPPWQSVDAYAGMQRLPKHTTNKIPGVKR